MDKQYDKRLRRARRRPKSGNTHQFTQNDTKENIKLDGIDGFWFKKFTSIHDRLALEMNRRLQGTYVSEWMTKGKTTLNQKDPIKGTAPSNYRPTEKSIYGLDLLQKGIWNGPAKLENKLPQNVQNIRWSHKHYWENYEKQERES